MVSIIKMFQIVNRKCEMYFLMAKSPEKAKIILDKAYFLCYHIAVAKDSRYASCSKSRRGALIVIFCVSFCLLAERLIFFGGENNAQRKGS